MLLKWKLCVLVIVLNYFEYDCLAQTDKLSEPWKNEHNVIVIDAYGPNIIDFQKISSDNKVVGLIHKASQGFTSDDKFYERRSLAKQHNLLFGSYHLGLAGNPKKQAKFYLKTIGNYENEILALDLEGLTSNYMSLEEAIVFIEYIHKKTNQYPVLYVNHQVYKELNDKYNKTSVFSKCPLWYARFRKNIPSEQFKSDIWNSYFLWQFSSELNCKKNGDCHYNVPGTRYDIDVNVFAGTKKELTLIWHGKAQ
ncbi:glycoside hydrolase family 25 protein [Croceitalea rosinachiae]|uniref:Glycoside hydrolase family 25 protein n=1 Tax=Croceitalea rosinachiae TaxID=3075596 RepID=A0ABU3ACY7_9FLAO|nr:glycoside hydrolase family 25 protein [Croceitalea sp. F388]MDT0608047.1 glycoside hydrolase family 25 protein [Croceitalea sp. F388]